MAKWVVFDALNLAFRCFYAIPELTRNDGFPTNALHGWVRSLWRVSDEYAPKNSVVVFDVGEDKRKKELLPEYKEHRKEMPEALAAQLPYLKESAALMGLRTVELSETEADDLIATLAARLTGQGDEVFIVSADKDLAQCVNSNVRILLPPPTARAKAGWTVLDEKGVEDKYGVPPSGIADLLALVGDTSDNIPGLAGVGPKTAAKWLREYGDIEEIISNAGTLSPRRFREQVGEKKEELRRNLKLTRLRRDLELPGFEEHRADPEGLIAFLEKMEMKGALADAKKRYLR